MAALYDYVGPSAIREAVVGDDSGVTIDSVDTLRAWSATQEEWEDGLLTLTFVVVPDGVLRVAPRRSEHVACALGGPVLAAGELTLTREPELAVIYATNQSTGYCPRPECWSAALAALQAAGIPCPVDLTQSYDFRFCTACQERMLVKEQWFVCDLCGNDLPQEWNFGEAKVAAP